MDDRPPPLLLIAEVRQALEAGLAPGFPQKVAANALGIALRELEAGSALTEAENARLVSAVRRGHIDDALVGDLIRLTLARIEVDQPAYPPFRTFKGG